MSDALEPNGYKIRLIMGVWHVLFWRDNICLGSSIECESIEDATEKGKATGLPDIERELGDRGK